MSVTLPDPADVRLGTVYGDSEAPSTGTLAVPEAGEVAYGVAVDDTTGTRTDAAESDVRLNVSYGDPGAPFTGELVVHATPTASLGTFVEEFEDGVMPAQMAAFGVSATYTPTGATPRTVTAIFWYGKVTVENKDTGEILEGDARATVNIDDTGAITCPEDTLSDGTDTYAVVSEASRIGSFVTVLLRRLVIKGIGNSWEGVA